MCKSTTQPQVERSKGRVLHKNSERRRFIPNESTCSLKGRQTAQPDNPMQGKKKIRDGIAIPKRDKLGNFYIRMKIPVGEKVPYKTIAGIDPGKLYSGIAIQTPKATLWPGHLVLPFPKVKKAITS